MRISPEEEVKIIKEILTAMNVPEESSDIVADVTLDADLKGFSSHGIGRFPQYVEGLRHGTIRADGDITIERETESTALINGNHIFGHVVAYRAMELAIEKARNTGVGLVGVHDSNHFGVAGYYSDMAVMNDMIGVVIANTEPAVAPIGGRKPILGTNPVAIGIPSNRYYVSVDMATSASARGKLLEAARKGESIPENVALDAEGKPTTDPEMALKGSILPFGGHKGYALSFMIEILAGPLVGAAFGTAVTGTANPEEMCTKGDLMMAIDPSKMVDPDEFRAQVDEFIEEVKSSGDVLIPGDIESMNIKRRRAEGIELDEKLLERILGIARELDINLEIKEL